MDAALMILHLLLGLESLFTLGRIALKLKVNQHLLVVLDNFLRR